jgi:hypothetical protein
MFLHAFISGVNLFQPTESPSSFDDITEKEEGLELDLMVGIVIDDLHEFGEELDGIFFSLN